MSSGQNQPEKVFAVVVSWNRVFDTLACIESLLQQQGICPQVILVDNASTDETILSVQRRFPQVHILSNVKNLGFGRATNQGLSYALQADARWILIINNDAVLAPNALALLLKNASPDVGLLSPVIYYASHPQMIWSSGGNTHAWNLEKSGDQRGQLDPGNWPEQIERDFVTGCTLLFPRQTLEAVGPFDEHFQMYYEDSDLCRRVRQAGLRILVIPAAKAWHKVALSSGGSDTPNERYWMAKSSLLFFRKHARPIQFPFIFFWRLGSAVKTTLRLAGQGKWASVRAYWQGLKDGMTGTL